MMALGDEYTRRYGKTHLSITKCKKALFAHPQGMTQGRSVQPPQCMPDEYKADCAIHAYWNYYLGDKHSVANSNETIKTRMYER